jgi:hypothetical protein
MEKKVTYHKEPELRIVPCSSIQDRVYVVEEHAGLHESIDTNDSSLVVLVKKDHFRVHILLIYYQNKYCTVLYSSIKFLLLYWCAFGIIHTSINHSLYSYSIWYNPHQHIPFALFIFHDLFVVLVQDAVHRRISIIYQYITLIYDPTHPDSMNCLWYSSWHIGPLVSVFKMSSSNESTSCNISIN